MIDEFLLTEDGFHIILEDGTGDLLLEPDIVVSIIPVGPFGGRNGGGSLTPRNGAGGFNSRAGAGGLSTRKGRGGF